MLAFKASPVSRFFLIITIALSITLLPCRTEAAAACSSCLVSTAVGAATASAGATSSNTARTYHPIGGLHSSASAFILLATRRMVHHFGYSSSRTSLRTALDTTENNDDADSNGAENELERKLREADNNDVDKQVDDKPPVSAAMVGAIGVYKNYISPLLPPACRFVPTCSQYGVQAIQEFGPTKGAVLTAWRLLRCSPFGGRGYDPPKWPPVFYTHGSY